MSDDGYRRPALTVDAVVLCREGAAEATGRDRVLLVQRGRDPFAGQWALPGGFVDYGEDPDLAVARELREETGLDGLALRQFHTFGAPDRDPRGHTVSVVYVVELDGEAPPVVGGDDAAAADWFPLDALPPLAFDHGRILDALLPSLGPTYSP